MAVKNTLFHFWKQKEYEWGRDITVREVADSFGANWNAIDRLRKGVGIKGKDPQRLDTNLVNGVCKFFDIPAGPVPFIEFVTEESSDETV